MFGEPPKCTICQKEIKGDDTILVMMRYPKRKGMTEIKAYLKNEGKFICEDCYNNNSKIKHY